MIIERRRARGGVDSKDIETNGFSS